MNEPLAVPLAAVLLLAPETFNGSQQGVDLTRAGLIACRPNLCSRMPVAQTPHTINSELEAPLVAEIEALENKDVY